MSNSPRPIPKGYGGKSDDEQDTTPVVFPPLMSTLDVYVDASAEQRYNQVVDKVKAAGKKKATRKAKKKTPQSNAIHMEPLAALVDANRPESRLPTSKESPRGQFHLRDYSSGDREDYNFDSLSLESAPKRAISDRKIHISSPPPSSDRKQMSSRPNFTPYSPARILVQPASQGGFNYKNPQLSPSEGGSPGGHTVQTQHTNQSSAYHNAPLKSDLGFGKAVQSIAAIKLHNFAMKRRDHVSHKLKLLREIRSFEKENNADMVVAQKMRKDEVLAAWKIRYYIEYLRLNSVRHIVEHTTQKNIELEDECSLLQQSSAVAEIENESLTKEIARLSAALGDNNTLSGATIAALTAQVQDLTYQLQASKQDTAGSNTHAESLQQTIAQVNAALLQEKGQMEVLQTELSITRLTCQELVRASGQKDGEIADLSHELQSLRAQHAATQVQLTQAQVLHGMERERAAMREEDNQIRYQKTSTLHAQLHDRERTIRAYEADFNAMTAEVSALQAKLTATAAQLATERASIGGIEQEKSGLQKLLSELAKRLTQADEDKIKSIATEKGFKSELKSANNTLSTQAHTINDLESQLSAAHDEIEFLVEENHELGREIECHHMYGEEMNQRYMVCFTNAERSLEYSRFLEEELFCARKLYEKSSAHYHDIHNNNNNLGSAGPVSSMFGDVSEESYGYRNTSHGGQDRNNRNNNDNGEFERPKSTIENWTGLEPMQPMVIHLNSFSRAAPRSASRQGRNEFDRPNSASMYNPDSRPQSTNAGNSSIMAEQRLLMVLNTLEEKMKNVDRAADSLRFLAEKADAIEKVQSSTQSILNSHNTAAALARQPVRLSVLREQQAAEKNALIEKHMEMERVFSDMHASLDQVSSDLRNNQTTIMQLQDRRAEVKETISGMKKRIKKSRKASIKDPSAVFLTESEEAETESNVAALSAELESLKEQINQLKVESVSINAQSVDYQTELYRLDQELEQSSHAFFDVYNEHVTAYYPPELAHLIEDSHIEEHGRYTIQAPLDLHLNTLYEENDTDDWSSVNTGVNKMMSSSTGNMNNSTSVTSGIESGVALEHSVFESAHTLHTLHASTLHAHTDASIEDVSELESPFLLDSPSPSRAKKAKKSSKSRKNSEFSPSEGAFNPPFENLSPSSRERKSSKMHKLGKQKSKSRKNRAKSDSFGDFEESGMDLEEGSSGTVDPDFSLQAQGNLGIAGEGGMGLSLDRNDSVYNVPNMRAEGAGDSPVRKVVYSDSANNAAHNTDSGNISNDATPRWNSPLSIANYTSSMHSANAPYSPPYSPQYTAYSTNPTSAYTSTANTTTNTANNTTSNTAYSTAYNTTFNTPSPSRGRPHSEADRSVRQQQALAREHLAQLRAEIESAIVNLDATLDTIEQYEFNRSEVRGNIARWVQQYTALCGYAPTVEDKLRSLTLQPLLHTYHSIQADLQLAHSKALTIATTATTLRTKLLTEQHAQHATLPVAQLEEQLALLYPISSVEDVFLEDPLLIPGDEELHALHDGGSMVSELSASLQGSLTFPNNNTNAATNNYNSSNYNANINNNTYPTNTNTNHTTYPASQGNTTYYVPTHYGSATQGSVGGAGGGDGRGSASSNEGEVHGVRQDQFANPEDAVSFAKSEKKAKKAAKKAAKKEKSGKYLENSFGVGNNGGVSGGDDSSVNSVDEDSVVSVGNNVTSSVGGVHGSGANTSGVVDTYGFDADPNYHATYHTYNSNPSNSNPNNTNTNNGYSNSSYYSVPTTPYATQLGVWNNDGPGFTPAKPTNNTTNTNTNNTNTNPTHPSLTLTGQETTAYLLSEEKRLKKALRAWNMDFTATNGRKPLPTDFDNFSDEVKGMLYSKNVISNKLFAMGYSSGKYTGVGGVNDTTSTTSTSSVVRPKSRGTETEPIPEHSTIHHPIPTNNTNSAANATNPTNPSVVDNTQYSVPTTPYTNNVSSLHTTFTTTDFASMRFNTSAKFASLFADTDASTINTEALLHEQGVLKNELRVWASEYNQLHGKKPLPADYDTFSTDIKAKIYRKNYIKRVLQENGVSGEDSVVSGTSGASGSDSATSKWRARQLEKGSDVVVDTSNSGGGGVSIPDASTTVPSTATVPNPFLLEVGTRVEGNYHNRGHWYSGVISGVNTDGTYSVTYEDSLVEDDVTSALLRVVAGSDDGVVIDTNNTSNTTNNNNTTHTPYDINTDTNIYATNTNTAADGDSHFSFSLPNTPFTKVRKTIDTAEEEHVYSSNEGGDSHNEGGAGNNNADTDTTGTAAYATLYTNTITDLYNSVAEGTTTIESLLQEQHTLRTEIRQWTQDFIQQHNKRPAVDDFNSFDTELKLKLIRKNQLKKLLQEYGITSSVSRKYGDSGNMDLVEAELTVEQIEGVRSGRPSSREFTAGRSSRGSSRGRDGTSSRGNSRSRDRDGSGGTSSRGGSRSSKRYRAANNTNLDTGADNTNTNNTDTNNTTTVDSMHDAIQSEPAESLPIVNPDTNKTRRNKVDPVDSVDHTVGVSLDAYTMSLLHPNTTNTTTNANTIPTSNTDTSHYTDNTDRVSTAQSNISMYSVPTTPYANHLATLDGTEQNPDSNTSYDNYDDGNSIYDQSIKLPTSTTIPATNTNNTNTDLDTELKSIKKELRRWNVTFMRQNGRLPGPEDFVDFDESVKLKLVRKKQLQVLIGRRDSVFESEGGVGDDVDVIGDGVVSAGAVTAAGGGGGGGGDDVNNSIADAATDKASTEKRPPHPARSTSASTTNANTFVNTYANRGAVDIDTVDSSAKAANPTNNDNITSEVDITPYTTELAQIKKFLKDWQANFVSTHSREPLEEDLTHDILELGVRRSELRSYIASVRGRSSRSSSRGGSRGSSRGNSGGNSRVSTADGVSGKGRSSRGAYAVGVSVDTTSSGDKAVAIDSSNTDSYTSYAHVNSANNATTDNTAPLLSPTKPSTPSSGSSRPRHSKVRDVTVDTTSSAVGAGSGAGSDDRVEYTGRVSATNSTSPTNNTTNTTTTATIPTTISGLGSTSVDRTGLSSPKGPKRVSFINHNTSTDTNSSGVGASGTGSGDGIDGTSGGATGGSSGGSGAFEVPLTPHPAKSKHLNNTTYADSSDVVNTTSTNEEEEGYYTLDDDNNATTYPANNTTTPNDTNTNTNTNTSNTNEVYDYDPSDLPPLNIPELAKEYSKIKKALKKWQKDFVEQNGREPVDSDFDYVDESLKELIVRKYELKEILGDNTQSVKVKEPKEGKEGRDKEGKEGKKSKKNKSGKSARFDYQHEDEA